MSVTYTARPASRSLSSSSGLFSSALASTRSGRSATIVSMSGFFVPAHAGDPVLVEVVGVGAPVGRAHQQAGRGHGERLGERGDEADHPVDGVGTRDAAAFDRRRRPCPPGCHPKSSDTVGTAIFPVTGGTPVDRWASGIDTAWLQLEQPTNRMVVHGVLFCDGPVDVATVRERVARAVGRGLPGPPAAADLARRRPRSGPLGRRRARPRRARRTRSTSPRPATTPRWPSTSAP